VSTARSPIGRRRYAGASRDHCHFSRQTGGTGDLIRDLLDEIGRLGSPWLQLVAFGLAFGETAFLLDLLVPGEVGLVVVGAGAARGGEPLVTVIAAAALGATLGDSVGWLIGRYGLTWLLARVSWLHRHLEPRLEPARAYFEQRGGAAVFLGRFVGALRSVVAIAAGLGGMPFLRFLKWNVAASIVWTGLVVSAGYLFGRNVDAVVSDVGLIVAGAILAGVVTLWLVVRWRKRRNVQMTAE
jgi:membrane protein DedA with SNARE-associated domain